MGIDVDQTTSISNLSICPTAASLKEANKFAFLKSETIRWVSLKQEDEEEEEENGRTMNVHRFDSFLYRRRSRINDDDQQESVLLDLYVYKHRAQLFTVNYLAHIACAHRYQGNH